MPAEQKEAANKQVEELKTMLANEQWTELKQKLDEFDQMASQFAQNSGK
jgi:hypothetical protein